MIKKNKDGSYNKFQLTIIIAITIISIIIIGTLIIHNIKLPNIEINKQEPIQNPPTSNITIISPVIEDDGTLTWNETFINITYNNTHSGYYNYQTRSAISFNTTSIPSDTTITNTTYTKFSIRNNYSVDHYVPIEGIIWMNSTNTTYSYIDSVNPSIELILINATYTHPNDGDTKYADTLFYITNTTPSI